MNKYLNRKNKFFYLLSLIIVLVALFLRLYKISSNFVFVYDQGRDALKIQEILSGDITFIGPTTGISGFFLGPFFYYLILPFYWLGGGNPVFPISFLVILSVIGIIISSLIVKAKSGWVGFFISSILLAFNFSHVKHSRWLSNPNPILFFGPLYFYILIKALSDNFKSKKQGKYYWLTLGLTLGLLLQTELANAIFFIPVTILVFLFNRKKVNRTNIINMLITLFLTQLPLILFNLKNKFIMLTALQSYFSKTTEKLPLLEIFKSRPIYYYQQLTFFFSPKTGWLFFFCLVMLIFYLLYKKFWTDIVLLVLALWLFVPLILLLFYNSNKGLLWDYYLITQPVAFIMLISLTASDLISKLPLVKKWVLVMPIILFLIYLNFNEWLIIQSKELNKISFGTMKQAIDFVYREADRKPFDVEVFVPNLMPTAYEYLFSWYGKKKYGYTVDKVGGQKKLVFFLLETRDNMDNIGLFWRNWWYNQRQEDGKIIKKEKIGDIEIEVRERLDK